MCACISVGIMMPVVELHSHYYRPALYDDLVTVKTILKELPDSPKIQFHSELYNEAGQLLNKGVTTLVFYEPKEKTKTNRTIKAWSSGIFPVLKNIKQSEIANFLYNTKYYIQQYNTFKSNWKEKVE